MWVAAERNRPLSALRKFTSPLNASLRTELSEGNQIQKKKRNTHTTKTECSNREDNQMIEPLPQLLLSSQLLNILPVFCFLFFTSLPHVLKNHNELSTNKKKTWVVLKEKMKKLKKETVLNVQKKSDAIYTSQLVSTFTTIGMWALCVSRRLYKWITYRERIHFFKNIYYIFVCLSVLPLNKIVFHL